MKNKFFMLALSLVLLISLSACGGNKADPNSNSKGSDSNPKTETKTGETLIRLSHNMQPDTSVDKAAKKFKELVEERSKGALKVEIYGQSQLGSMREQTESVQFGSTEMTIQPISTLTPFVEDVQIIDFPFLWPSNDEVLWKVLDGETGQDLLGTMEDAGFKGLGYWAAGFKAITTSKKTIKSPEDLKGLKMRVMPSPLLIAQYKAWGANPVPIDFAELYNSLQQGVVDGQENPFWITYSQKYQEVQKNLTITNHGYLAYISAFNKNFFDGLSPELQEIIIQAEIDARELGRKIAAEDDQKYLDLLKQAGMNVYTLTEEEKAAFVELSLPVYEEFTKTDRQKELFQKFKEDIKAAQK